MRSWWRNERKYSALARIEFGQKQTEKDKKNKSEGVKISNWSQTLIKNEQERKWNKYHKWRFDYDESLGFGFWSLSLIGSDFDNIAQWRDEVSRS